MRTMANLPLTGSQYWGAALNNYLRQINSDVASLKLRLDNFSITASYSGSGWVGNIYNISISDQHTSYAEAHGENTAVYKMKYVGSQFNPTFKISGTLIFNNPSTSRSSSISMPESQNMKISFGAGENDRDDLRVVHQLSYNSSKKEYEVIKRSTNPIEVLMPSDGYYPVYAIYDGDIGFVVALNSSQEFIFHENYVLLGIAAKMTDTGKDTYFFGRKTDSAFKSIYETRKGNLESFATIINNDNSSKGFFKQNDNSISVLFGTAVVDYHSNGITDVNDAASKDDYDYKHPYDYKRFSGGLGRSCYMLTNNGTKLELFSSLDVELTNNSAYSNGGVSFSKDLIYGIYISALGDIIVEESGKIDSIDDLLGRTSDYIWSLNSATNCRTGGLVFLGAFYHGRSGWTFMQAALNSISPSFISSKSVENTSIVKLPDVTYMAYETVDGVVGDVIPYRYEVKVPGKDTSYTKDYYLLQLRTDFTPTGGTSGDYKRYSIPVFPYDFYSPIITDSVYKSTRIANIKLDVPETYIDFENNSPAWHINAKNELHGRAKLINAQTTTVHTDTHDGYDNILENVKLVGKVSLSETTTDNPNLSLNRTLTDVVGIGNVRGGRFYINAPRISADDYNLYLTGGNLDASEDLMFNIVASKAVPTTAGAELAPLRLMGSNTTIEAQNNVYIKSGNPIQFNNTIVFTSDERCKTNIKDVSEEVCVNTVRNLDVKTFTYTDTNSNSIGIIAQELERLCPEYKDLLVFTTEEADLTDKKNVAEAKLLFILWKAVQYLLKKEG